MPGNSKQIPIVVICGPTASGKTSLACSLAENFELEIVSADSRQVYRGMDIGSAKPSPEERNLVTHHLIDIRNPDEDFSAAQFQVKARRIILSRARQGKSIIVVGGTGFYIRALTHGLFPAPGAACRTALGHCSRLAQRSGKMSSMGSLVMIADRGFP